MKQQRQIFTKDVFTSKLNVHKSVTKDIIVIPTNAQTMSNSHFQLFLAVSDPPLAPMGFRKVHNVPELSRQVLIATLVFSFMASTISCSLSV
jgi:hypothetical protein